MLQNTFYSKVICSLIYIFAFWLAYMLLPKNNINIWIYISLWHLYATIIIYIFSVLLKNSSLYDPFWSIAPVPIVLYLTFNFNNTLEIKLLVLVPILFWALRLTRNWLVSWRGFQHEDFRYIELKNTNKIQAEINNFFGIHLIPTFIVNLGLLPLLYLLTKNVEANIYLYIASIFTFGAVILETVSDEQMRKFRANPSNKGKTMRFKLWKYSRHPNYLGEISFWFGIYFMALSTGNSPLWIILCPLTMLALFVFVSCPMMDKRSLENRSDYKDYMDKTSQLMFFPPKR